MTPGHALPVSWLDGIGNEATRRGVCLIGVRYQDGGRTCIPCDPVLAAEGVRAMSVEQRPGCGGLRTFVALWDRSGEPLGAWIVPRSAGAAIEARWRVLLLELLVLADREERQMAAK